MISEVAMKYRSLFVFLACCLPLLCQEPAASGFDRWFLDQTLRIDYYHVGDAKDETIALDRLQVQGAWAGVRKRLTEPFAYGRYRLTVRDAAGGGLLYATGFDSYFGEYKTTAPALAGVKRTYHESALIPM